MLVSIIIIKLIMNLIRDITILVFNLRLCFKIENLFGAQFGELEKMYINSHKKHLHEDLALTVCALLIICCIFTYLYSIYCFENLILFRL